MDKNITIIDKDYSQWVKELVARYRQSQIKAAIKVNQEPLQFYWELGKDIVNPCCATIWMTLWLATTPTIFPQDRKPITPRAIPMAVGANIPLLNC